MATYRAVHISFWTDPKVDDDFTPEDKYFYLYLLTNPHTSLCGCYEISMKQMERETGYSKDTIVRLLSRMEHVHNVIEYDANTKEVFIPKWGKYNWQNSPKTIAGAIKIADSIKSEKFRKKFNRIISEYGYPIDTLSIGYGYPMDTSVTVTVTDTVSNSNNNTKVLKEENVLQNNGQEQPAERKTKARTFVAPSQEEVQNYAKEKNLDVDPVQFYEYFTTPDDAGRTWIDAKGNPVRNWRQKMQTWSRFGIAVPRKNSELPNANVTGFSDFCKAYPKPIDDYRASYDEYLARIEEGYSASDLLGAAKAYASECRIKRVEAQYMKSSNKFLCKEGMFTSYMPKEQETKASESRNPFADYNVEVLRVGV